MSIFIKIIMGIILAAIVFWLGDRLMLWAEDRGWIFYRRKKPNQGSVASAFLSVQSILEPGKTATVEEIRKVEQDENYSGDPPSKEKFTVAEKDLNKGA